MTGVDDTFGSEWTVPLDQALKVERDLAITGTRRSWSSAVPPPSGSVRMGLSSQFNQQILRIRHPEPAASARSLSLTYSPSVTAGHGD